MQYTHLVKFDVRHPILGALPSEFRTTADAVELHKRALAIREHRGHVCNVRVSELAVLPQRG